MEDQLIYSPGAYTEVFQVGGSAYLQSLGVYRGISGWGISLSTVLGLTQRYFRVGDQLIYSPGAYTEVFQGGGSAYLQSWGVHRGDH